MVLKEFLERIKERKNRFKELEDGFRNEKKLIERQKNSNEREVERYKEEERQERIKIQLKNYRKRDQDEFWRGHSIMKNNNNMMRNSPIEKNIFHGGKSILLDNKKLF